MRHLRLLLLVIISFLASRALYYYLGVRFEAISLVYYRQFIDPLLLKNNLLQSVFYLHSQPPLFNLFLGIVLKLFPNNYVAAFAAIYCIMGLVFAISIFLLLARLGVSGKLSAGLAILFIINPSVVLYENWLFYTYPLAVLLCLSTLFLHRFLSDNKIKDAVAFFTLLAIISLSRSIFHIAWFLAIILVLVLLKRPDSKKILIACSLPFMIVSLIYVKNFIIFKNFSIGSIYMGLNLAEVSRHVIPNNLIRSFGDIEDTSRIFKIKPFSGVSRYKPYIKIQKTGIPVLDEEYKSTKYINYHNIAYIEVSSLYMKDYLALAKKYPKIFLSRFLNSYYYHYFLPANRVWPFLTCKKKNYDKMAPLDKFYNLIFCGELNPNSHKCYYFVVGLPFLIIYGVFLAFKSLKDRKDPVLGITVLYMLITIMTVNTAASFLTWEHNRLRFQIDSYYLLIFGVFITNISKWLKGR